MEPLGCLILHGFTSSLDTVRAIGPRMERRGIPYRMPILRGHCTSPEDLRGVIWNDWYMDASTALTDLLQEARKAVVIGLSMGGLVALQLSIERPGDLAGAALIAPALRIAHPLIWLCPLLTPFWRRVNISPRNAFTDHQLSYQSTNYRWCPSDALVSLYHYGRLIESQLPRVHLPLLIIYPRKDRTIKPISSQIIYERVASVEKQLLVFERSGHEMLQDCEAETVLDAIEEFVASKRHEQLQPVV